MGIPLSLMVTGLRSLSLASTLIDAPNFTGTPTFNGESPNVSGVDVPLVLTTTPHKYGFAIEQGAVDGLPLIIHVPNNVRNPAFPILDTTDFKLLRRLQTSFKHKHGHKESITDFGISIGWCGRPSSCVAA